MNLKDIRNEIDVLDDGLLNLFLQRLNLSDEVAKYKAENNVPIRNKAREREILENAMKKAGDKEEYAYHFFNKILDLSRSRQWRLNRPKSTLIDKIEATIQNDVVFPKTGSIACQGVEGSNAQAACDKIFPRGSIMYVKSFKAVFDALKSGLCQYGVVPIENSANGSVRAVYNLMREYKFSIVRSTNMLIRHELLAKEGAKLEDIKTIYSHEQALGQCSNFLAKLKNVNIVPYENTASAAKMVAEMGDNSVAAIASPQCADLYKLVPLSEDIQDSDNNYTRFICITKDATIYSGANRISLILSCENKPGSLNDVLSIFSAYGVNMSKLESYPVVGRNFEFVFFIDLDANIREEGVLPMLSELEGTTLNFEFLGNYSTV